MNKRQQQILDLALQQGILRARDLESMGLPRAYLTILVRQGALVRLAKGLYARPDRAASAHDHLLEIATKYPQAVFCLLTALSLHGLTTQAPHEVWLAIDGKARAPSVTYPPLRLIRMSGSSLTQGVEHMNVDGTTQIRVTSVAKTVADCFKYRNKIGLDVALEALREARSSKRATMDELWQCAQRCRVSNVMRPCLESLV